MVRAGDHPRSRGVYVAAGIVNAYNKGIIPARAGFTDRPRARTRTPRDHPRSRGVYGGDGGGGEGLDRIIPARAGFTRPSRVRQPMRADHPRSRGVYLCVEVGWLPQNGSSPLARGLRPFRGKEYHVHGIIPARAGFTRGCIQLTWRDKDHPRSRGVY